MTDHALPRLETGTILLPRALRRLRSEVGLVWAAVAVVGLHVADDNYLQPAAGTSAADHLVSGLVPLALLAAVAIAYGHLRAGVRAAVAVTTGALGASTGVPGIYHVLAGSVSGDDYTGLLAAAAGVVLVLSGPVVLWRARRRGGSRRRRYLRRLATTATAAVVLPLLVLLVLFPVGFSYGYTHVGRTTSSTGEVGLPHETVTITTSDSIELSAAYVPSRNGAAVVVYPGAAALKEARMLARNGYGVLLLDPRGQGRSGGDNVRWDGALDLLAAAAYLQTRADVDPHRIAGFGSSVGGEILIEAAARSTAFAAVVSEGAGWRIGEADLEGPGRLVAAPILAMMTAATTVFSNRLPPPPIVDRIGSIAPRPVLLVYAEPGMGGEDIQQPKLLAAAGEGASMWKVPGAGHTGGIDARPAEYERRVTAFLAEALGEG